MSWTSFDNGASIGQRGSENGTIIRDGEHVDGARITLERDENIALFSITGGIYGWMVHTCFAGTLDEADAQYEEMKDELSDILNLIPYEDDLELEQELRSASNAISKFVEKHW